MRTSPLRAFASDNKKKKESEKKNKKVSMQDPDSGGFMHPPYKVQRDLAGNVKYYHGFKKKNKK
tara:strand:+ start:286 stop:477 length:192 start_codon:yes stop_codon:yes gene_type:complete